MTRLVNILPRTETIKFELISKNQPLRSQLDWLRSIIDASSIALCAKLRQLMTMAPRRLEQLTLQ